MTVTQKDGTRLLMPIRLRWRFKGGEMQEAELLPGTQVRWEQDNPDMSALYQLLNGRLAAAVEMLRIQELALDLREPADIADDLAWVELVLPDASDEPPPLPEEAVSENHPSL
ncbi:MAG: hypothetical protein F4237_12460 [Gemmatimonadetes bacterium]|nr:hypothetical protein [Gemmatimonadota bacterium]